MHSERPDFASERTAFDKGVWPCAGADEAGRGPLAGPVVAAAVILDPERIPAGIDDSKRLTAARREALFAEIMDTALAVSACSIAAESIDRSDIRKASLAALARAANTLSLSPKLLLIDGRDLPDGLPCAAQAIIGGDRRCLSIAAASIIAKTLRDRMMVRASALHPQYGFASHKGYASAAHRAAIADHGGCLRLHRFTFAPLRQAAFEF